MGTKSGLSIKAAFACAVVISLSSGAVCRQQETAEQFVERVLKAIKADEWGRARRGVRHALELEPSSPQANFVGARVYLHDGAVSMAIDALTKAVAAQPFYPEAHLLLARCLLRRNSEKARQEVNTAIGQGAPQYEAYRLAGEIDVAENKFDAAIVSFETALQAIEPGGAQAGIQYLRELVDLPRLIGALQRLAPILAQQETTDVVRPVAINSPQPRYTEEARSQKLQGAVFLTVLITETGDADSVIVLRGLGAGLNEQAVVAAKQLKFTPAQKDGNPIPYWMNVLIEFNLR
jgi:TonB family protein